MIKTSRYGEGKYEHHKKCGCIFKFLKDKNGKDSIYDGTPCEKHKDKYKNGKVINLIDDKWSDFVIIGFPKCGQNSLIEYLQKKYSVTNTIKDELIWRRDAMDLFKSRYWGTKRRPVIILRDPIERIWSHYHYFNFYADIAFEKYLLHIGLHNSLGEENPIMQSNYDKWIEPFKIYDPLIINLDEIKKDPDFPMLNKTIKDHGEYEGIKNMPEHLKDLTRELLEIEKAKFKSPSWSTTVGVKHLR